MLQYFFNRQIVVQYAFKKETRGERHGSAAERLLAGSNPDRARIAAMMSAMPQLGSAMGQANMMGQTTMPPPPPAAPAAPAAPTTPGQPMMMQPGMMGGAPMMQPGMMGGMPMMQPGMMGSAPLMQPGMMGVPMMQPGMMGTPIMPPGMMGGMPSHQ